MSSHGGGGEGGGGEEFVSDHLTDLILSTRPKLIFSSLAKKKNCAVEQTTQVQLSPCIDWIVWGRDTDRRFSRDSLPVFFFFFCKRPL